MLLAARAAKNHRSIGGVQTSFSPTNKASDIILSSSNTAAESNSSAGGSVLSATSKTSGKFFVQCKTLEIYTVTPGMGFGLQSGTALGYIGSDTFGVGIWTQSDNINRLFYNGATTTENSHTSAIGDLFSLACDFNALHYWASLPGMSGWIGGGDPASGTTPTGNISTLGAGPYYFAACPRRGDSTNTSNRNKIALVDPSLWSAIAPSGFGVWT